MHVKRKFTNSSGEELILEVFIDVDGIVDNMANRVQKQRQEGGKGNVIECDGAIRCKLISHSGNTK